MGKEFEHTLLQRRYTNGQQTFEKKLSITNYQKNANQNYNKITSHPLELVLARMWKNWRNLCTVGMVQNSAATTKNTMAVS